MTTSASVSVQPSSRVVRRDEIVFTVIDDTVVMMDVVKGCYYELDSVGTRIWALVESGPLVAEMCEALVAEYEVVPDVCRDEVRTFLDRLDHLEVIRILPQDDATESGKDESRPAPSTIAGEAPAAPRQTKGAKLRWTPPVVWVMETIRKTASGSSWHSSSTEDAHYRPPPS